MKRSKNRFSYDKRIVAFIDIMGMSEHLAAVDKAFTFVKNVSDTINEILRTEVKLSSTLQHIKLGYDVETFFPGWVGSDVDCRISSISDSIVISVPESTIRNGERNRLFSLLICLETVFGLQRQLIQLGILTRGGISFGHLYHANNIVIGDGLVSAYKLETQAAIFPRVILDESIQQLMMNESLRDGIVEDLMRLRVGNMFSRDNDGMYFVDYLGLDIMNREADWSERFARIDTFVRDEISSITDLRVKQKLFWLQTYIRRSRRTARFDAGPFPHTTKGDLESKYHRTAPKWMKE